MTLYAYNKLDSHLLLRSGYIELKAKAWTQINAADVAAGTFNWELAAGRIEIKEFNVEPEGKDETVPEFLVKRPAEPTSKIRGKSETLGAPKESEPVEMDPAQLKAYLDKKNAEPYRVPGKVEAIGYVEGSDEELRGSDLPPGVTEVPTEPQVIDGTNLNTSSTSPAGALEIVQQMAAEPVEIESLGSSEATPEAEVEVVDEAKVKKPRKGKTEPLKNT